MSPPYYTLGSSRGLGLRILIPATRIRIPYRVQSTALRWCTHRGNEALRLLGNQYSIINPGYLKIEQRKTNPYQIVRWICFPSISRSHVIRGNRILFMGVWRSGSAADCTQSNSLKRIVFHVSQLVEGLQNSNTYAWGTLVQVQPWNLIRWSKVRILLLPQKEVLVLLDFRAKRKVHYGGVGEWFKPTVLKTVDLLRVREFESRPLRKTHNNK